MSERISVVINTLNVERTLPYALRSVQWADEIIVVDMHSEDRTAEIARTFGAKVYLTQGPGVNVPARAFAIAQASNEWILVIDADELVPESLCRELKEIARSSSAEAVELPFVNYLLGAALSYTGWGPSQDSHLRFFRKGKMIASPLVHHELQLLENAVVSRVEYDGSNAIVHFAYGDVSHFVEKLNRYTTIEAKQAFERGDRANGWLALPRAARQFLQRYLRLHGYRDGWRGLYLSGLMAMYRWTTHAKLQELESTGGREAVLESYRLEAERIIAGYEVKVHDEIDS
jgi:glycosyltransferase involved in cell wall biosynthesis